MQMQCARDIRQFNAMRMDVRSWRLNVRSTRLTSRWNLSRTENCWGCLKHDVLYFLNVILVKYVLLVLVGGEPVLHMVVVFYSSEASF